MLHRNRYILMMMMKVFAKLTTCLGFVPMFLMLMNPEPCSAQQRHGDGGGRRLLRDDYCLSPTTPHLIVSVEGYRLKPGTMIPSGTEISVTCAAGYWLTGANDGPSLRTFCLRSGGFLADLGVCAPVCGNPPRVPNGRLSAVEFDNGLQVRRIICEPNYRIGSNKDTIFCGDGGKWSAPEPCQKVCGRLPTIANGIIVAVDNNERYVGATRRVVCNNGFILSGASTVTCGQDGHWHFRADCWRTAGTNEALNKRI